VARPAAPKPAPVKNDAPKPLPVGKVVVAPQPVVQPADASLATRRGGESGRDPEVVKKLAIASLVAGLVGLVLVVVGLLAPVLFWTPMVAIVVGIAATALGAIGSGDRSGSQTIFGVAVMGLLSGVLAILVGGIATYQWASKQGQPEVAEQQDGASDAPEPAAETPAGETEPAVDAADAPQGDDPPASDPVATPNGAKLASVNTVRSWKNAGRVAVGLRNLVKIEVVSAWLAVDDDGKRADGGPAGGAAESGDDSSDSITLDGDALDPPPGVEDADEATSDEAAATPAGPAKYVFVEVKLTNQAAGQSLQYTSFNQDGPLSGAILAADKQRLCPLAPSAGASAARRKRSASIGPGQSLTDLLVFHAPAEPFESLQLVLPYTAIGEELVANARTKIAGFEISKQFLTEQPETAKPADVAADPNKQDPTDKDEFDPKNMLGDIERSVEDGDPAGDAIDGGSNFDDSGSSQEFDPADLLNSIEQGKPIEK